MAKKWIPKKLKKGAFTAYCKKLGYSGVTEACIERGLHSSNPTTRARARLARTFRNMVKRRKAQYGLEALLKDITNDELNLAGLTTFLGALSTGALVSSLANLMDMDDKYLRSTVDNIYAFGGDVVPIEAEGGEVIETPQGVKRLKGPDHSQGGIPLAVPEGSTVYSKRIVIDGKSMADRKLERERKENKYRKLVDKTKDPIFRSTLTRILEINDKQDKYDRQFQNMVRGMYNGTAFFLTSSKYAYGGDIPDSVLDALIQVESSGNPNAVSRKGARGYAQFMPDTWNWIWSLDNPQIQDYISKHGKPDIHTDDIYAHRIAAEAYLSYLMDKYKSKGLDDNTALIYALAAYNMGEGKVDSEVEKKYSGDYIAALKDWQNNSIPFVSYAVKVLDKAGLNGSGILASITSDSVNANNAVKSIVTVPTVAVDDTYAEKPLDLYKGIIKKNSTTSTAANNSAKSQQSANTANNDNVTIEDIISPDSYISKTGAAIGETGTVISAFAPLVTTLIAERKNRPFENYYKDYGQQLIENAIKMYDVARSSANIAQNEIARQQYLSNIGARQNLANSVVRSAAEGAAAARANIATTKAEQSYMSAISNINSMVNQLIGNIERVRLAGAQQADMWNRRQQDNTWNQLVRSLTNLGVGLQSLGKQESLKDYNKLAGKSIAYMKITP